MLYRGQKANAVPFEENITKLFDHPIPGLLSKSPVVSMLIDNFNPGCCN